MAKYKIAWMPGDGIGNDVMEATRIVLDAMKFDAEYVPVRYRVGVLVQGGQRPARPHDRGPAGARPAGCSGRSPASRRTRRKESWRRSSRGRSSSYFSPIVKLRQMFNLHTNMRPCKSYPGNPLNYRGTQIANPTGGGRADRSGRVPREHRGDRTAASSSSRCPSRSTRRCAPTRR